MDEAKLQNLRNIVCQITDGQTPNDIRRNAEATFLQLINTETSSVFFCLANTYSDVKLPKEVRAGAAGLLRMSLTERSQTDQPFWHQLEADLVDYIKQVCLTIPFLESPPLTELGCRINATIYAVEIEGRGWKDLLARIVQAIEFKGDNYERYNYAAITTVETICDMVTTKNLAISETERADLISTIFLAISMDQKIDEIKIAGFKVLALSINFFTNLFRDEHARTHLFTLIVSSFENQSSDVMRGALQCLIELVKPFYGYLGMYLGKIIEKLVALLVQPRRGNNVAILATEFFNALATEDLNQLRAASEQMDQTYQPRDFVRNNFREFLPKIMMNLLIQDNNDGQVQNSVFSASVQALIVCNEALGDDCIPLTQDFIGAMDKENNPVNIVAALTAFKCLIKSISRPQSFTLLSGSYHQILTHLDNQDASIRLAAVEMLQTIADCCPAIMMSPDNSSKYFGNFFTFMEKSQDYPISIGLCKTFKTLISTTPADNQQWNHIWSEAAAQLSELTLRNAFLGARGGNEDIQVIGANLEVLVYVIQKVYTSDMIYRGMEHFLKAVTQAYDQPTDRRESLLEGILVCIGIAIHKSRRDKSMFPPEFYIDVFKHLLYCVEHFKYMHRESVYVVGVIATHLGMKIAIYSREVFNFLKEALNSSNEQYINCAFEVFGMMSRDRSDILDNVIVEETVVPCILSRLNDQNCTLESKVACFITLGELALSHLSVLMRRIREIFEMFRQGFESAYSMMLEKDPISHEVAMNVASKLIESHLCIMHGFYEENRMNHELNNLIELDFKVIARFIEGSCHPDLGCTLDHVVACLGLITDTVVLNPASLKGILAQEFPKILEIAKRLRHKGTKTEMQEVTLKFFENHTMINN